MTFLVTSKMSPALAARVEASVRGRKSKLGFGPVLRVLVRVVFVLSIVVTAMWIIKNERANREHREAARAALLKDVRAEINAVSDHERRSVERVDTWMGRLAGESDADLVSDGWRAALTRPGVYLRASHEELARARSNVAAASMKDALLYCLVEPPTAKTEKVLLTKVRAARTAQLETATPYIRRAWDAQAGLPFLQPSFAEKVEKADMTELTGLRERFEHAPLAPAKQALRARILIAVIDEPGSGVTELDGERAHDVRLSIVDLETSTILLRVKRHVDPSWISPELRPTYAHGLDSCAMAFDIDRH